MISADDLELLVCTDDPAEVERIIVDCYRQNCAEAAQASQALC